MFIGLLMDLQWCFGHPLTHTFPGRGILKRPVRFYRRGSVTDHTQLEQDLNAMALNLVVAAITLWNTAYLDRAITLLEQRGTPVPAEYLPHISPLGWEHITITGTYHWKRTETP